MKQILQDAVESIASPKFTTRLVSDADDVGVIQKRIVQGIYNSDIIVCDVSGRNPNVMFELGMRLAFDKPTVIVKDDKTDYSFDTSIIEHLPYPRDLRFSRIVAFKKQVADKVLATYVGAKANPDHSTFLKNFGTFKVAHLDQKEAPGEQVMLELLQDVQREMGLLRRQTMRAVRPARDPAIDNAIVTALLQMKGANPSMKFEANDELIDAFIEGFDDVIRPYASKRAFQEALHAACEAVKLVS